jgi:DNA-directed RNA polymerase specialized sigma24 family protein
MTTTPQPAIDLSAAAWIRDPDLRQESITALLDQKPTSPEEAAQIVQRVRWTHQRHRRRDQRYAGAMPDREADDSDHGGRPAATPVTDAVQRLPEHLRKVMLLRFVANREVTEVAETLNVSIPTIVRWTKQAIQQIKEGDL